MIHLHINYSNCKSYFRRRKHRPTYRMCYKKLSAGETPPVMHDYWVKLIWMHCAPDTFQQGRQIQASSCDQTLPKAVWFHRKSNTRKAHSLTQIFSSNCYKPTAYPRVNLNLHQGYIVQGNHIFGLLWGLRLQPRTETDCRCVTLCISVNIQRG